jgi:E3 ubiquitin-protein ligase RGLG
LQQVIDIMGRTLEVFDDDHLVRYWTLPLSISSNSEFLTKFFDFLKIPAFGFGDERSGGTSVTPFFSDRPCNGFQEVLTRYSELTPQIKLAAPTTFAPLIKETIKIVKKTKEYHILLIIADGEVSTSELESTAAAIVEASSYPISIIMVGVGDGPWEAMEEFDDGLPERKFDNFQFVNFHECLIKYDGLDVAFVRFIQSKVYSLKDSSLITR